MMSGVLCGGKKKQEKFPSDFDTLNQGDEGTCVFTFKNTGTHN